MTDHASLTIPNSNTTYRLQSKKEIVFEHEYAASPERLFAALCDPTRVQEWWGSRGASLQIVEMDVRSGGKWRFVETDAKGRKSTFHGEYKEVDRPHRIVSTLCYGANPASKLFAIRETYELVPLAGGSRTLLPLTSVYPMGAALNGMLDVGMDSPSGHMEGSRHQWRLDRLASLIEEAK